MSFQTEITTNATGSTSTFPFPFKYVKETDVKVTLDGADQILNTHYTFATSSITFTSPPTGLVRIFRDTDLSEATAEFFPGSAIRAQDLNNNNDQVLFSALERKERSLNTTGGALSGDLDMANNKIVNVGTPTANGDATNKTYVDAIQNANDAALATAVSNAQAAQVVAEGARDDAQDARDAAQLARDSATGSANTASGHADDAEAARDAAQAAAGAAANFTGAPVFIGLKRNVANGRTVLRVDYSEGSNTTNTYDPKTYYYKQQYTCQIFDNGLLFTEGANLGQPKIEFATTTDASRTSGHVYIQLH